MTKPAFALAFALLLAVPGSLADAEYAPSLVTALAASPLGAVIGWTPGPVVADSYRVYGIDDGGGATWLAESAGPVPDGGSLPVPSGFAQYAVTGVLNGIESDLVFAIAGAPPGSPCVEVYWNPLTYSVDTSCLPISSNKLPALVVRS